MLPKAAGSTILKTCESKIELEHNKYEREVLQLAFLMQTCINGYEIYKNVGVMHAVVFVGGALEAKNAQVVGHNQNFEVVNKRKNDDRNGQKSDKYK